VRRLALVVLALGCAAPPAPPARDTLHEVTAIMEGLTRDGSRAHRGAFAPEVSPSSFPAESLTAPRFVHLRRLRQLGRALVVEAALEAEGRRLVLEVWLEPHEGGWRITGWDPELRALGGVPARGTQRLPLMLAGKTIRGGLLPRTVADPRIAPLDAAPARAVQVHVRLVEGHSGCGPHPARAARALRGRLEECYQARFPGGGRQGRLTLRVRAGVAALTEATLVDEELGLCARRVLGELGGESCRARVRLTFKPAP
jgi:hypothetical protein